MRVMHLHVSNFRSIRQESVALDRLTAFVGANGSGKSSFLRALHVLFSADAKVTVEDFHGSDTASPIIIGAEVTDLTPGETERFADYVSAGSMRIERVFQCESGEVTHSYYGYTKRHLSFAALRAAKDATEAKGLYNGLREQPRYENLPVWKSWAAAKEALRDWERAHPEECSLSRDEGAFFTLKPMQIGCLTADTIPVFVPAVSDALEESADGGRSPLQLLMDLAVRERVSARVTPLQGDASQRYKEAIAEAEDVELRELAINLSERLARFCPEANLALTWESVPAFAPPLPRARLRISEGDHASTVDRCGHGVQRGLVLALLQSFAERSSAVTVGDVAPRKDFLLLIEEPELYQHPSRQRHFARTLRDLSEALAPITQVVYATHSPLFVGVHQFDRVRLVRKMATAEGSLASRVTAVTFDQVAARTGAAAGETHSAAGLRARLEGNGVATDS